jgi:hypothetical protein
MGCGQPVSWPVHAVTNRSINDLTAAIPLKFDPYTPRWADSHGDDGRHCLLGINAKDRGAHAKLGFILLRREPAMTPAVSFVKNSPTPQIDTKKSCSVSGAASILIKYFFNIAGERL